MTTVNDADREAADAWANDTTPLVQAFARHREQAILEGMEMMREAAAKLADDIGFGYIAVDLRNLDPAAVLAARMKDTRA